MISPTSYCSSQCSNTVFMTFLQQAISSRYLPSPTPQNASTTCQQTGSSSTALNVTKYASAAAGAAGSVAAIPAVAAALPLLGPAALIAAPILAIVGTIFANHAKAVALQSNVLCENVPAANAAFQQIDAGLANGAISPAQASVAYQTMQSSFAAAMRSDPSFKTGDALWGFNQAMQAVIAQRMLDLQALPGGAGASSASIAGVPWYVWAIGAGAVFFLM
jgi:hypothetical protein